MALGAIGELQLSLIGAGLAAVAAVWGYNAWQEYRQRKLGQRMFRDGPASAAPDVLMQNENAALADAAAGAFEDDGSPARIEPTFAATEESAASGESEATLATIDRAPREETPVEPTDVPSLETSHEPSAEQSAEQSLKPSAEPPQELADDFVDCVICLDATEQVAAPLIWAAQRQLLGTLERRLSWSGLDESSGLWRKLHAHDASSYRRFCAALQIADRSGPINAADLARFLDAVRQLAGNIRAEIELPAAADVLAHARELDEFCAGVDWRIGVNVVNRADQPFGAARLIDLATETSLWLKDDGMFHAEDANGLTAFTLSDLGGQPLAADGLGALTLDGVTLSIDVPRVAGGPEVFDRLLGVARRLMETFDGIIVDDQRKPLSDAMLAAIRAKIEEFQQKMAEHRIPAGGRRALRLYS